MEGGEMPGIFLSGSRRLPGFSATHSAASAEGLAAWDRGRWGQRVSVLLAPFAFSPGPLLLRLHLLGGIRRLAGGSCFAVAGKQSQRSGSFSVIMSFNLCTQLTDINEGLRRVREQEGSMGWSVCE